jgi:hypothetical protein
MGSGERPGRPIGPPVVANRRSPGLYGIAKHDLNVFQQTPDLGSIKDIRWRHGIDSRTMQGLIRVDIADAGDDVLIEEGRLDRAFRPAERIDEQFSRTRQGIGSKYVPAVSQKPLRAGEGPQAAEPTGIGKDQRGFSRASCGRLIERPDAMDMAGPGPAAGVGQQEPPAHTEVDTQDPAVLRDDREVFAVSSKFIDATALEKQFRG